MGVPFFRPTSVRRSRRKGKRDTTAGKGTVADRLPMTIAVLLLFPAWTGCTGEFRVEPPEAVATPSPSLPAAAVAASAAKQAPHAPAALPAWQPPAAKAAPPAAGPRERVVTVAYGDTIGLYARWSGLSRDELLAGNRMSGSRGLRTGRPFRMALDDAEWEAFQRLRDAHYRRREAEFFRTHRIERLATCVVRPGDTWRTIAKRYSDVPAWLMEKVNRATDLKHLRPNDRLFVPLVEEGAPTTSGEALRRAAAVEPGGSAWRKARGASGARAVPAEPLDVPSVPLGSRGSLRRGFRPAAPPQATAVSPPGPAPGDGAEPGAPEAPWEDAAAANWFSDGPHDQLSEREAATLEVVRVKVKRRECLAHYARWAGTSVKGIVEANGLKDPGMINIGHEIRVPMDEAQKRVFFDRRRAFHGGDRAPTRVATPKTPETLHDWFPYEVRSGETAWVIANRRFRSSVTELRHANPGVDLGRLRVGQTLRIPLSASER